MFGGEEPKASEPGREEGEVADGAGGGRMHELVEKDMFVGEAGLVMLLSKRSGAQRHAEREESRLRRRVGAAPNGRTEVGNARRVAAPVVVSPGFAGVGGDAGVASDRPGERIVGQPGAVGGGDNIETSR